MSNYQRLISYIYTYEGGIKGKNIGFAKLETRGNQCRIAVNVKKIFVGGNPLGVYLLTGQEEVKIGTLFARNGAGEFRTVINNLDVENSGYSLEDFFGLSVHDVESTWRCYTTIWEDAVAHAAEVELADVTADKAAQKEQISDGMKVPEILPISREIEKQLEQEQAVQEIQDNVLEERQNHSQEKMPEEVSSEIPRREKTEIQNMGSVRSMWIHPGKVPKESETAQGSEIEAEVRHEMLAESRMEVQTKAWADTQAEVSVEEAPKVQVEKTEKVQEETAAEVQEEIAVGVQEEVQEEVLKEEQNEAAEERRENLSGHLSFEGNMQPGTLRMETLNPESLKPAPESLEAVAEPVRQEAEEADTVPPSGFAQPFKNDQDICSEREMWERLRKRYPKILAFDYADGCEVLTIKPQDIGLLPRETWVYGNNSFLLHGFYNYRYLILAKLNNPKGSSRYLLGVPGHYFSNEKYMASMFGFSDFVLSKKQPSRDGRFGYWYTDVKIGE